MKSPVLEEEVIIKKLNSFEKDKSKFVDFCFKVINLSKKHQFEVYNKNFDKAREILEEMTFFRNKYKKIAKRDYLFLKNNLFHEAEVGFAKSLLLQSFIGSFVLISFSEMNKEHKISLYIYLNSLIEFLSDLKNIFLKNLTENNKEKAKEIKDFFEKVYKETLNFNLDIFDLKEKFEEVYSSLIFMEEVYFKFLK